MKKIFKVADIRELETQVWKSEISYSKMVDILNEMAFKEYSKDSPTSGDKCPFSKDLFIETIHEIEKQHRHDQKCSKAFEVLLPSDFVSNYDNHWLRDQLIKILQEAMKDNTRDSWINYFIWDLDFGSDWKEGCIEINGKDIKLRNADDLWNLLNNNLKNVV